MFVFILFLFLLLLFFSIEDSTVIETWYFLILAYVLPLDWVVEIQIVMFEMVRSCMIL